MNVGEMMDQLALRLNDGDKTQFTDAQKLPALNSAQLRVANLVHDKYLSGLEVIETSVAVTDGVVSLSSALSNSVLKDAEGVKRVKVSSGLWCTEIEIEDVKGQENRYHTGTLRNPLYYTFQNSLYILPTTVETVDICYLRHPLPLLHDFTMAAAGTPSTTKFLGTAGEDLSAVDDTYNDVVIYCLGKEKHFIITDYDAAGAGDGDLLFTVTPAAAAAFGADTFYFRTDSFDETGLDNVTPEINVALHSVMLDFAEAECWGMADELDRKASVQKTAYQEIDILNAKYKEADGIGIKDQRRG